jgi:amphi-Trp domain-containing protein
MSETATEIATETELYFKEGMQPTVDVASRLRKMADQLEAGSIRLGNKHVKIPEYLVMKIELEEEHNGDIAPINFEIEIELVWPVRMQED